MENWVKRLNERHGDRLREPVTCRTCHAVDPREKNGVLPPLMASFVRALREKPANANPAKSWKPLLKDTESTSMLCSVCHGEIGTRMEQGLDFSRLQRPDAYADDKTFMVYLMEEWVAELNRKASDRLVKAVVCVDCHDADPRR
jgi:cytochrome c553